jgi:hypothetical protein
MPVVKRPTQIKMIYGTGKKTNPSRLVDGFVFSGDLKDWMPKHRASKKTKGEELIANAASPRSSSAHGHGEKE